MTLLLYYARVSTDTATTEATAKKPVTKEFSVTGLVWAYFSM